jgi:hypothetical protein
VKRIFSRGAGPSVEDAADVWVHLVDVLAERRRVERDLHDLAVLAVVRTVAQQQAVGEDAAHDDVPRAARREHLLAVEKEEAVRVGTEERDQRHDRGLLEDDRPVAAVQTAHDVERFVPVAEGLEKVLEERRPRDRRARARRACSCLHLPGL